MTTAIIRINFIAAVWISIGLGALLVYLNWPPGDVSRYSPEKAGVFFGLLLTFMQLLLWRVYYQDDERPWVAAVVGTYFLLPIVAAFLANGVNGTRVIISPLNCTLAYLSLSHLVYSAWRWRISTRSWLDI